MVRVRVLGRQGNPARQEGILLRAACAASSHDARSPLRRAWWMNQTTIHRKKGPRFVQGPGRPILPLTSCVPASSPRASVPPRAAVAFDVTAETMLRYYTASEKKKT